MRGISSAGWPVDLFFPGARFRTLPRRRRRPHLPAGILSPYRDGERGAFITAFASHQRPERAP
ncbi:hypothetical protein FJ872_32445, partial [Mesorhizobium sp. B2-5-9]